jgi:hypothetical protein
MIAEYGGWIEGAFTAVVVLGFCAYQYWATNRSIAQDNASARDTGHAEGEHQLDDRRDETVH